MRERALMRKESADARFAASRLIAERYLGPIAGLKVRVNGAVDSNPTSSSQA
jgi:hypothetical protein